MLLAVGVLLVSVAAIFFLTVAWIVAGLWFRPVVLAVLIVHGVAQLWPWIALAYSAIPWFLWLGAGGIVLIVLAARYERRIANLKSVALRIIALR